MWLERWDPFKEFERLHREIDSLFEERTKGKSIVPKAVRETEWYPAVDIYEDVEKVEVRAEIPGIKPNDIEISVEGNVLTIKGERKFEQEEKKGNYLRVERSYGTFTRTFSLPEYVETDKIKADYKEGILDITIPKKPETKPKKIKVEVK